ncbi:hypothetical protein V6Z11_A01G119000 [Gossypium hirsutum]
MCYPKGVGSICFRNLHLFNLALLGRQVLSAKYFSNGDVFSYKRCDKPSFTWASIAKEVDALKDGFIWQSVFRSPFTNNERKVKDLWDYDNWRWKRERVIKIYSDNLGDCICNLPIPHNGIKDTRTWIQNSHGIYTSKSAYSWLILKEVGFGPYRFFWCAIWKLKMLSEIKIFSWRIGFENTCPRCDSREETLIHVMKDCPKAHEILVARRLNNRLLEGDYNNCIDWLEDIFRVLEKKAAADFLTLLWNSWNDRNNMIEPLVISSTLANKGWKKPPTSYVKVNVDATILNRCSGVGAIARDQDGFVLGGCYKFVEKSMDVSWAELEAFNEGISLTARLNVARLSLESDSALLICKEFDFFVSVQVNWISRTSNNVADLLCNLAVKNKNDLYFDMDYPADIHDIIINDAIR